jgi:hypothetical protein
VSVMDVDALLVVGLGAFGDLLERAAPADWELPTPYAEFSARALTNPTA